MHWLPVKKQPLEEKVAERLRGRTPLVEVSLVLCEDAGLNIVDLRFLKTIYPFPRVLAISPSCDWANVVSRPDLRMCGQLESDDSV